MKRVTFTFTGMVDPSNEHAAVYLTTEACAALRDAMDLHGVEDVAVSVSVVTPKAAKVGAA